MLPKNRPPTHPGEMLLKEFLEPSGISQSKLARHLGWPYSKLNEIINGKRSISADDALAIGEALGVDPVFWLNLQRDWNLWHSLQKHHHISQIQTFSPPVHASI
ncbi:MAG TPA: HigA family addiction module antitoxin [Candidatus Deferrimicrobium sp.]|nr:HigA family addiction module antitoxin [Candidatus Kapabacteria bacterium]HLP60606.1 HigA family addiction module antitoxin [Candidatus Deferrimicrobium sp.]